MLEAALSKTFEGVVSVMVAAMEIVKRLRDAHIDQKVEAMKKKLEAETPEEAAAERNKLEDVLEAAMRKVNADKP
jgi:hypothetical protein